MFKNGSFLSVVTLVSLTLLDSNPHPRKKDRIGTDTTTSQERRGAKTVFLRRRRRPKASNAFTRTRLPTFGVSAAFSVEHCRLQKGRLVRAYGLGCLGVQGVQCGGSTGWL